MAEREEFQAGQVGGGISSFLGVQQPGPPRVRATDFSGIRNALAAWQDDAFQEREAEVMEQVGSRAAQDQDAMGTAGISEAPEMARRYQAAYTQKARIIYDQQIKTEAFTTANSLLRNHRLDPEGFNQSWQEYTEQTRKSISESDPELAVAVGGYLQNLGAQYGNKLTENVFQRDLETQTAEVVSQLNQQLIAGRDSLVDNPDEVNRDQIQAELNVSLLAADEAGLLTPGQIQTFTARINDDLSTEYVRGRAAQAMAANDVKGVQYLVGKLRSGTWFDDNNKARALANELEGALSGGGVASGEVTLRVNTARDMFNAAKEGMAFGENEQQILQESFNFIQAYGKPGDVDKFIRYQNGIQTAVQYREFIGNASQEQLQAMRDDMASFGAASNLPVGYPAALVDELEAEAERRFTSLVNRDYANLGVQAFRDQEFAEVLNADPASQQTFFNSMAQNRKAAASQTQAPVQTIPFWSKDKTEQAATMISNAMDAGDTAQAYNTANFYMEPYRQTGDTMAGAREIAAINPELGGAIIIAEALAGVDGRPAEAWFNLTMQGRDLPPPPSAVAQQINNALAKSDTQNLLLTLSNGDARATGWMRRSIEAMMNASAQVTPDADPVQMMQSMVSRLETVTLPNNMKLLARDLGDGPSDRKLAAAAINGWFADRADEYSTVDVDNLRPVPVGDGVFQLKDTVRGRPLFESDGVTPVRITVNPEEYVEARQADKAEIEQMRKEAVARMENQLNLSTRSYNQSVRVGNAAGLDETQTKHVWRAISNTPATDMARLQDGAAPEAMGTMLQPSEYEQKARELLRQDRTGRQQQINPREARQLGTVLYYGDLLKQFDGDERKALAALHTGVEDIQEAIDAGGDDWEQFIDMHAQTFIHRGLSDD